MNKCAVFKVNPLQRQNTTPYFCFSRGHSWIEIYSKIGGLCELIALRFKSKPKILCFRVFPYY